MGLIRMNYNEVFAEADRLSNLANVGEQYLREIKRISSNIPAVWKGEASNAFIEICNKWDREMTELVNSLNIIASNLRTIASEIRAAEERLKRR